MANPTPVAVTPPKRAPLARRAGGAVLWNLIFLPVKAALALGVSVVLVRGLRLDNFAAYAYATSLLATIGLWSDLGIERALPRFVPEVERRYGRAGLRRFIFGLTTLKMGILVLVSAGLWLFADTIIGAYRLGAGETGRAILAMIVLLLALGALYDIATQFLYSFFKQKITNLLDITVAVVKPALTAAFVLVLGWGVVGVLLALLLTTLLSVVTAVRQAWLAAQGREPNPRRIRRLIGRERQSPASIEGTASSHGTQGVASETNAQVAESVAVVEANRAGGAAQGRNRSLARRFATYAGLMYAFSLTAWLYDTPFIVLILGSSGDASTAVSVAIVRIVYNLVDQLLQNLQTPFVGIQTPLFATLHSEQRMVGLRTAYNTLSKLQTLLLVPSGAGLCLLGANILNLLYVQKLKTDTLNAADLPLATAVLVLTVIFAFGEALIGLPVTILMVFERYRVVLLSRLLPLLIAPLLVLDVRLGWGLIPALLIMGLLSVAARAISLVAVRSLGLFFPARFLAKVCGATAAFALPLGVVTAFAPLAPLLIVVAVPASIAIFVGAFKALGGFDREDKDRLVAYRLPFNKYIVKYL